MVPSDRSGHVTATRGDHARAMAEGCQVEVLLFEILGGFSQPVVALLKRATAEVDNRLATTR